MGIEAWLLPWLLRVNGGNNATLVASPAKPTCPLGTPNPDCPVTVTCGINGKPYGILVVPIKLPLKSVACIFSAVVLGSGETVIETGAESLGAKVLSPE
jgi:hypothetical protein